MTGTPASRLPVASRPTSRGFIFLNKWFLFHSYQGTYTSLPTHLVHLLVFVSGRGRLFLALTCGLLFSKKKKKHKKNRKKKRTHSRQAERRPGTSSAGSQDTAGFPLISEPRRRSGWASLSSRVKLLTPSPQSPCFCAGLQEVGVGGAPRCPPWEVPNHFFFFLFFFLKKQNCSPGPLAVLPLVGARGGSPGALGSLVRVGVGGFQHLCSPWEHSWAPVPIPTPRGPQGPRVALYFVVFCGHFGNSGGAVGTFSESSQVCPREAEREGGSPWQVHGHQGGAHCPVHCPEPRPWARGSRRWALGLVTATAMARHRGASQRA